MVGKMAAECTLLVHLGDTKSGSGPCNDTLMAEPLRIMIRAGTPALYTLGDNEATDCHRMLSRSDMTAQGGVVGHSTFAQYPKAAEFLTAEGGRSHMIQEFFTDRTTDLTGKLPIHSQSADCPFNQMVVVEHMVVTTIEMPGSNFGLKVENNMELVDSPESHQMMYDRANGCNMDWIPAAAQMAVDQNLKSVLIGFQAAWWDPATVAAEGSVATVSNSAYQPFLDKMLEVTAAHPDIMFYTIHADAHFWLSFSPGNTNNWMNLMIEGSDYALTSYAKFTADPNAEFDPLTVKEVHARMSEAEAATYSR